MSRNDVSDRLEGPPEPGIGEVSARMTASLANSFSSADVSPAPISMKARQGAGIIKTATSAKAARPVIAPRPAP